VFRSKVTKENAVKAHHNFVPKTLTIESAFSPPG